ncbi:MAG: phosphatidylserine/phosphatidylglycerophosphate/cardiolipin synthase family protein [Steroidobacteraceae bacterium]
MRHAPFLALVLAGELLASGCATTSGAPDPRTNEDLDRFVRETSDTSVLGPDASFIGSPLPDVGLSGLFPVHGPDGCSVAVLDGGEDSFAVRMEALRNARTSIRIQALVFKGDETGLRVAQVLKEKKAAGLDVRVIVDAFSNPWLQTQWMYFDLKQHGIEVEGYEAMALQWLNEVPIPLLTPHTSADQMDRRFHEKMWIIDGETDHGVAITGGLNIGNEYFRANPADAAGTWRDQDVVLRGTVVGDLVTAFDRNFDYFIGVKQSRGPLNTNLYWDATRSVLDKTGKVPISYQTDPAVVKNVDALESRQPSLRFRPATCRFLQNRPRLQETYIQQAYIKLIERARREVLIANAYFVPTHSLKRALTDAAKRCVSVNLISNSPSTNDLPEISMVGRGHYRELLAVNDTPEVAGCTNPDAGMHIWEWVGQAPDEPAPTQGTMHSKFAVFDGERSLVGSYNLDPRSEKLNSETAVVFLQPELSKQLRAKFLGNDLRYSRAVTPEIAAQFEAPESVIERFRKSLGEAFEVEL